MASNFCVNCGGTTRKYKTTHQGHLCHVCFLDFTDNDNRSDNGHPLPEDDTQLQVYVVRIRERVQLGGKRRDHTIVVLATAPEMATKSVFKQFGYGENQRASLSWTVDEVHGPFKSGSVLADWEH